MRQNAPNPISISIGPLPLGALSPDPWGGEGGKGRETVGEERRRSGEGKGRGKFASLLLER